MTASRILLFSTLFAMLMLVSWGATAQEADSERQMVLEEVIVTATKRETSLQDTSESISVFSERLIEDIGAQDFSGLVDHIAGVEYRTDTQGIGNVSIRGVASLSSVGGSPGAAVGYYLDELPLTMAGMFPDIQSFDIERVEVLRGPQGTLYGEGSMAGTIRLISAKPDPNAFSGKVDLTYSNTDGGGNNGMANAVLNLPLIKDTLALRVAGFYSDMSGYVDAINWVDGSLLQKNSNTVDTKGGRISLAWTPNDDLSVTGSVLLSYSETGDFNTGNTEYQHATSTLNYFDDDLEAFNLTIDYSLPFADLVSSTSYFDRETNASLDQGDLVDIVNEIFEPTGISVDAVFTPRDVDSESFSQEIRLVSTGDGPWQWTTGVFYKQQDFRDFFTGAANPSIPEELVVALSTFFTTNFPPFITTPMTETTVILNEGTYDQIAAFGEVSYDFNDEFRLLVGGRLFREDRDSTSAAGGLFTFLQGLFATGEGFLPSSITSKGSSTVFNPKVTLTYNVNDDSMMYGTVSQGFRSGGQNDFQALIPGAVTDYDPETLTNYEIGYKSAWLENRLVLNVAAFYQDWKDLQAIVLEGPGGVFESQDNVGDAHTMGIDVELNYLPPIEGLVLSLSGTLLEAETDEDFLLPDEFGGGQQIVPSGTRIPDVAEKQLSLSGQYNFPVTNNIDGFARLSYSYSGDSTVNLTRPDLTTPSYSIANARIGIEAANWQLSFFVDNLTDEFITLRASTFEQPFVGNVWALGRPRTYGVNLRAFF